MGSLNSPRKSYPPQCSGIVLEGHSRNTIEVAPSWQRATNITLKGIITITIKLLYWKQRNNVISKVLLRMLHKKYLYRTENDNTLFFYNNINVYVHTYTHTHRQYIWHKEAFHARGLTRSTTGSEQI